MIKNIFTLIAFWVLALFILNSLVEARETKMTASVPETEINRCVDVLRAADSGYCVKRCW